MSPTYTRTAHFKALLWQAIRTLESRCRKYKLTAFSSPSLFSMWNTLRKTKKRPSDEVIRVATKQLQEVIRNFKYPEWIVERKVTKYLSKFKEGEGALSLGEIIDLAKQHHRLSIPQMFKI